MTVLFISKYSMWLFFKLVGHLISLRCLFFYMIPFYFLKHFLPSPTPGTENQTQDLMLVNQT